MPRRANRSKICPRLTLLQSLERCHLLSRASSCASRVRLRIIHHASLQRPRNRLFLTGRRGQTSWRARKAVGLWPRHCAFCNILQSQCRPEVHRTRQGRQLLLLRHWVLMDPPNSPTSLNLLSSPKTPRVQTSGRVNGSDGAILFHRTVRSLEVLGCSLHGKRYITSKYLTRGVKPGARVRQCYDSYLGHAAASSSLDAV